MVRRSSTRLAMLRLTVFFVAVVSAGCGGSDQPATYPVSGKVTFPDGTPVKDVTVKFRSEDQTPPFTASGKTDNEGKFLFNAAPGANVAIIVPSYPRDTDDMTPAERYRAMNPIAPMFLDYDTSRLTFPVSADPAENEFEIKIWPPRR